MTSSYRPLSANVSIRCCCSRRGVCAPGSSGVFLLPGYHSIIITTKHSSHRLQYTDANPTRACFYLRNFHSMQCKGGTKITAWLEWRRSSRWVTRGRICDLSLFNLFYASWFMNVQNRLSQAQSFLWGLLEIWCVGDLEDESDARLGFGLNPPPLHPLPSTIAL